ncbi:hypothetical protein [Microcoleus sp. Pol10D4]
MNNVLLFNCGTGILPVTENAAQCAIDLTYSSTIYLHIMYGLRSPTKKRD